MSAVTRFTTDPGEAFWAMKQLRHLLPDAERPLFDASISSFLDDTFGYRILVAARTQPATVAELCGAAITDQIRTAYDSYMDTLYATWNAPGITARLRTTIDSENGNRETALTDMWLPEWRNLFADPSLAAKRPVIRKNYNELLCRLGESIGVEGAIAQIPARQGPSTKHPASITPRAESVHRGSTQH